MGKRNGQGQAGRTLRNDGPGTGGCGRQGPGRRGSDDADSIDPEAVARYLETQGFGHRGRGPSGLRTRLELCARGAARSRGSDDSWRHDQEADDRRRSGCLERGEAKEQLDKLARAWGYPDQRGGRLEWALAAQMPGEAEERRAGADAEEEEGMGQERRPGAAPAAQLARDEGRPGQGEA